MQENECVTKKVREMIKTTIKQRNGGTINSPTLQRCNINGPVTFNIQVVSV